VKVAREAWFEGQPDLDPARLVFLDETWTSTKMARLRGRSPRGERLRSPVPHGHWKTTTFVAGLRLSGMAAPFVLDGPINRDAFQAYVEHVLVPELMPGDIVVMDNLASHKGPAVRCYRRGRRTAPVPPTLLAGLQPDRDGLLQAQGAPAQSRRTHRRGIVGGHRPTHRHHHARRMRQLLRRSGI